MNLFKSADIAASGMAAERLRMEVVANNIANAHTTDAVGGGAFRRKFVVFNELNSDSNSIFGMHGVEAVGVEADQSPLERVFNPGHRHADAEGMVTMPNVKIPNEMIDLITASRSFEANLKSLTTFKEMLEQTLTLLRNVR